MGRNLHANKTLKEKPDIKVFSTKEELEVPRREVKMLLHKRKENERDRKTEGECWEETQMIISRN